MGKEKRIFSAGKETSNKNESLWNLVSVIYNFWKIGKKSE